MQYSQIPAALTKAFAASGDKNAIPTDANSSTLANGLAAFSSGFPPVTSLPASAGGQNPVREDFNGVLGMLTTIHQWQMTGAARKYESAFSTAIGGYPSFAVLVKANGSGFWISTADNNTTDPDSVGSANWKDLSAFLTGGFIDKLPTGTSDAMVASITLPTLDASFAGVPVFVRAIGANTSTTPTYGGKTIVKGNNLALVAGDIVGWMELQYDATWDKLVLQNPAKGVSISVNMASSATTQAGLSTTELVTPKGLADTMLAGVGTTINYPAGKALATNYTNSTGRPIFVSISVVASEGVNVTLSGTADGKVFGPTQGYSPSGALALTIVMLVPPGKAYRADITGTASLTNWTEVS